MKILLAVDGSEFTKKMLAYITTHEELFSPTNSYTLLTVQPQLPARARAAVGKEVVDTYQREEANRMMDMEAFCQRSCAEATNNHGDHEDDVWERCQSGTNANTFFGEDCRPVTCGKLKKNCAKPLHPMHCASLHCSTSFCAMK